LTIKNLDLKVKKIWKAILIIVKKLYVSFYTIIRIEPSNFSLETRRELLRTPIRITLVLKKFSIGVEISNILQTVGLIVLSHETFYQNLSKIA